MKVLQILVLIIGLSIFVNAQIDNTATLSGTVSDINGAAIPKVKIRLNRSQQESFTTTTNDEGYYSLQVPAGNYTIDFLGSEKGFLTTNVKNYRIAPTKMILDVILEIDMESSTTIYSEFICEPSEDGKEFSDCKYVSRKGNGKSKPINLSFQTVKNN